MLLAFGAASAPAGAGAPMQISAARVWPAAEYTRITLEAAQPIQYALFTVPDPHRVVLDLSGVDLSKALADLPRKISADDPYVKGVRVARNRPGVVRLVFDLKAEVKPSAFVAKPVGQYAHRLVLDLHPLKPVDPLLALLEAASPDQAAAGLSNAPERVAPLPAATAKPKEPTRRAANELVRLVTVAIDAGHGGEDPGAIGRRGTMEKDVTLAIARRVKAKLDDEPNMRAVLIRDGDYFVPLGQRVSRARRIQADLFVSIHADAYLNPDARGSSVFALSENGASSVAANWLAKRENDADLIGGVNVDVKDRYLKQTLIDLSQTATINDSLKLGHAVLSELGGINKLHKPRVEQAGFAVLKAPDIPSILVETAFITNPEEEARLNDEDYQDRMAAAIVAGIKRYFADNPALARTRVASN